MPFQEELVRRSLEKRARKSRLPGQVTDQDFSIRPAEADQLYWRDHARFKDITGEQIIGFSVIGEMKTGPTP